MALAQRVQERNCYRSDFFGCLREILSDRENIRIVGDRFVFQSEVLFPSGSSDLNPEGTAEMALDVGAFDDRRPLGELGRHVLAEGLRRRADHRGAEVLHPLGHGRVLQGLLGRGIEPVDDLLRGPAGANSAFQV